MIPFGCNSTRRAPLAFRGPKEINDERRCTPVTVPVTSPHMLAEIDGPIGWMTFNKPERHNAVSLDMWEAIPEILHRFENDPAVRVIVLKGAGGKAFVSGADISQFEKARSTEEANALYDRISELASKALADCGKPTIAMIHGFCIGGGLAIAIGCDIRIATDDLEVRRSRRTPRGGLW